jgi:TolB protein
MLLRKLSLCLLGVFLVVAPLVSESEAQTDITIKGATEGFPIAIQRMCDKGASEDYTKKISEIITANLKLLDIFRIIPERSFVESPGKCIAPNEIAFTDWTVIGAEGLVRGDIKKVGLWGDVFEAELFLIDVTQKKPVFGRRYRFGPTDYQRVANRFSNEIVAYFTGEKGLFGSKIAFVGSVGRFRELFTVDFGSNEPRQLTSHKGLIFSPAWAKEGNALAFTSYKTRMPELYMLNLGEEESIDQITSGIGIPIGAKPINNGSMFISGLSKAGSTNLVAISREGKVVRKLTSRGGIDVSPSPSPDGGRIAFCSDQSGGPQIYVMNSDGAGRQRVSFTNSSYCTSPNWSPKGDKLTFICRNQGNQVYVLDLATKQTTQVTFSGNNEDPVWSPDGGFIMYSSGFGQRGGRSLSVLSLRTLSSRILISGMDSRQPSWTAGPD